MIPQRGTDGSKRSRLTHSFPGPEDKEVPSIRGAEDERMWRKEGLNGVSEDIGATPSWALRMKYISYSSVSPVKTGASSTCKA